MKGMRLAPIGANENVNEAHAVGAIDPPVQPPAQALQVDATCGSAGAEDPPAASSAVYACCAA